jgi:hypothetical protein
MLKLINTKILLAILARCLLLAVSWRPSGTSPRRPPQSAAILQRQQKDAKGRRKREEAFRQQVEQDKKRHNSAAAKEAGPGSHIFPKREERVAI